MLSCVQICPAGLVKMVDKRKISCCICVQDAAAVTATTSVYDDHTGRHHRCRGHLYNIMLIPSSHFRPHWCSATQQHIYVPCIAINVNIPNMNMHYAILY